MSKVLNKLKSNNGATLMLALLFFVVCAVTGSMILVSATVSAGRLKNMRDRDQNYYAVRSAVEFMEDKLSTSYIVAKEELVAKEETTVVTQNNITTEKTDIYYTYDGPKLYAAEVSEGGTETISNVVLNDVTDGIISLLKNSNLTYFNDKDGDKCTNDENYPDSFNKRWFKGNDGTNSDNTITSKITLINGSSEIDALAVNVNAELSSSGLLTITATNESDSTGQNTAPKYSIVLKMQCNNIPETLTTVSGNEETRTRIYRFKFTKVKDGIEKA